jgi:hypothetical protein
VVGGEQGRMISLLALLVVERRKGRWMKEGGGGELWEDGRRVSSW